MTIPLFSRLRGLAERAFQGKWVYVTDGREKSGTSDTLEPFAYWVHGAGPRSVQVDRTTCIHADDMAYICALSPEVVLGLVAVVEAAEKWMRDCEGDHEDEGIREALAGLGVK